MLWLASYPRSGNTFFRIILDEVYGIRSSTYHLEADYPLDPDYASYPVVKTHLLPDQLMPDGREIPAVYLVRDGRDCVVSLARYRQQLLAEESDYEANLLEAINAAGGSFFGGWSRHVQEWGRRADLVIRFEDLIEDPIGCVSQLGKWLDLPPPAVDQIPDFTSLRERDFRYGSGVEHGFSEAQRERWRQGKFRRGETGAWRDELPHRLHLRFLHKHGLELVRLGYETTPNGSRPAMAAKAPQPFTESRRILIDGTKLLDLDNDGIKRYTLCLLEAMAAVCPKQVPNWQIDVSLGLEKIVPLAGIPELYRRELPAERYLQPHLTRLIESSEARLQQIHGPRRLAERCRHFFYRLMRFGRHLGRVGWYALLDFRLVLERHSYICLRLIRMLRFRKWGQTINRNRALSHT